LCSVEEPAATGMGGGHDLEASNIHVRDRPQDEPEA